MNTLDDLRATLTIHAPTEDAALLDRTASIRSRIRVVRRRRRVSAVVGAVAAVALIAAGIALPRFVSNEPDMAAPTTVTMAGFEYRLVRVVKTEPGQTRLNIDVPRKDADQAVMLLADGLGDGSATLQPTYERAGEDPFDGAPGDRIVHDGANPAIPLPVYFDDGAATMRYVLTVERGTAETRAGVAFYERTDRMPAGVVDSTGRFVYRKQVGSRRLLEASFGEPGQSQLTFTFTGRPDRTALEGACSLSPASYRGGQPPYVNISVDGDGSFTSGQCWDTRADLADGGAFLGGSGDGTHTVRVWASDEPGGSPGEYDGLVLGGAAYDDSSAVMINGSRVDRVVEFAGRTWRLDEDATTRSVKGELSVSYTVDSDQPVLLGSAAEHVTRLDGSADQVTSNTAGSTFSSRSADPGPTSSLGTVTLPGTKITYTFSWLPKDKDATVAIVVYRLED